MLRALYILIGSLLFGGIVHIAIILLIPQYGTQDAWTALAKGTEMWSFKKIDPGKNEIANVDPFFQFGTCRFDLTQTGLLMEAPQTNRFWSASVFDQNGKILYSLTNRSSIDNRLQLVVLSPVQMIGLREFQPKLAETAIVIEADTKEGFVVFRLFSPDPSWQQDTDDFMKNVTCKQYLPSADPS